MHKLKSAESQANLQKSAILPYFAPEDFLEGRRNSVIFDSSVEQKHLQKLQKRKPLLFMFK